MAEIRTVRFIDTGNGHQVAIADSVATLATYNAERARGIMHTPEWQAAMAQLQDEFDARRRR